MPLQVLRLLAHDRDLPVPLRAAIADGRLEQAGVMLMDEFDLTCLEAGELVDAVLCEEPCV
ncbi:MAG TPA: hypothetical protein VKB80_00020 [Kofleriaceae bacterium]|nr:hypothetical protein [Kofleriaceae bacterium]